jgi:CheY-like chemotaxis protein
MAPFQAKAAVPHAVAQVTSSDSARVLRMGTRTIPGFPSFRQVLPELRVYPARSLLDPSCRSKGPQQADQGGIMAKVLLVGYIRELLEDRNNALRAAGHDVTMALSAEAAYHAISQLVFDVAVLSYSIPEGERNEMAHRLTQASPDVKIVMIYFTSVHNAELADALVPTTANAQELVRAVNHVLKTSDRSETR